jgi:N-acetylglucosaminyl-diphospho-decaprenol L-rhamnosyltransferase
MRRRLSVIIVNYNTKDSILMCIDSIYSSLSKDVLEIIVVDNNSKDGSVKAIRKNCPQVNLIVNKENRGFASASNQGLELSQGEYILLLNPDTIVNPSLVKMLEYIENNKKVGILGCKVLNSDGSLQRTAYAPPSLLNDIISGLTFKWLWLLRPKNRWVTRKCMFSQEPFEVGWVSGACLLTIREVIQDIGLLDEKFFLGAEDVDWCCRARMKRWKVVYFPQTQVIHIGGQSKRKEFALKIESHYQKRIHFAQKYYGKVALRLIMLISLTELVVKEIIIRLRLNLNDNEKKTKLNGYRQALKVLLGKTK